MTGTPWLSCGLLEFLMTNPFDFDNFSPEQIRAVADGLRETANDPRIDPMRGRAASAWLLAEADALDVEADRIQQSLLTNAPKNTVEDALQGPLERPMGQRLSTPKRRGWFGRK